MKSARRGLVLFASLGLLAACSGSADEPATADESPPTENLAPLPVAEPPIGRQALLLAVARFASDFAAGRGGLADQRQLDGDRFEVRLRFGCDADGLGTRLWTYDDESRVLRIRIEPEIVTDTPLVSEFSFDALEAAEGFWVQRPWLLDAACPVRPASQDAEPADEESDGEPVEEPAPSAQASAPAPVARPRIGIAQFYTSEDSRALRRNRRAYEATVTLPEGEQLSATGYDLVLSGRLSALPDGRVIACTGDVSAEPPRCIVSVSFDHVALTKPGSDDPLAEWSHG